MDCPSEERMWLFTSGDAQRHRSIYLIQFDGKEGDLHDLNMPWGSFILLGGFPNDSTIVGAEIGADRLFFYSIYSQSVSFFTPPPSTYSFCHFLCNPTYKAGY
jgi:hypothetical protein